MKAYPFPGSTESATCLGANSKLNTTLSLCVSRVVACTKGFLQFVDQEMPSFK